MFIGSTEDLSSPGSIAQRLEKQKIIYKTFFYMLSVANTHIVADYLVQVTQEGSPQSLNLPPSIYALWRKAVLQTVRDLDPECDEDPDRLGHRAGAGAGIHAAAGRTASQS